MKSHKPTNLLEKVYYDPHHHDQQILMQLREYNDSVTRNIIQERNGELKKLETDIEILAEIQQDLASMVHSQGETINIAAENTEISGIQVQEATKHIEQAVIIQKKTNKLFLGGILTSAGVVVGGGLLAIASPFAGAIVAGCGIVGGMALVVAKAL